MLINCSIHFRLAIIICQGMPFKAQYKMSLFIPTTGPRMSQCEEITNSDDEGRRKCGKKLQMMENYGWKQAPDS
jgi:hypothetical protein